MKEKTGHSWRKTGHRFGTFPHHPTPSLSDTSLEDEVCGYLQDYQHLSAPVILIATRGTIAQKAWWCKKEKDTDNLFDYQCLSLCFGEDFPLSKWSWRGSNPRPNKWQMCFLHAYSVVVCRECSGRGHPRQTVASKNSPALRGFMPAIPSLRAPPYHMPTVGACGRCLVPTTVAGIKLTYCASVMQQERSYFRLLSFCIGF